MKIDMLERDFDYWEILRNSIIKNVNKASEWVESKIGWEKGSRMINPIIDISSKEIKACIGRLKDKDGYGLLISEEFLGWLDEAAEWMNHDVMFKRSLYMSTLDSSKDLSLWMHNNWLIWVVNHEFAHFICGHLSNENSYEWNEFNVLPNLTEREVKLRIACEFDADIFAATIIFGSIHLALNDERLKSIKDKYFFDIGMIFCGLFVAMDHMNPTPSTHPKSIERFMVFMTRGLGEYVLLTKKDATVEYEAFMNGAMKCLALLDKEGISYGNKAIDFDMNIVVENRELLNMHGFNKKRKVRLKHDWLTSDVQIFYFPSKKIQLCDLNKYPDSPSKY